MACPCCGEVVVCSGENRPVPNSVSATIFLQFKTKGADKTQACADFLPLSINGTYVLARDALYSYVGVFSSGHMRIRFFLGIPPFPSQFDILYCKPPPLHSCGDFSFLFSEIILGQLPNICTWPSQGVVSYEILGANTRSSCSGSAAIGLPNTYDLTLTLSLL